MNRLFGWLRYFHSAGAQGEADPSTPVINRLFHTVLIDGPAWRLVLA
jgi:hypothetical protein